MLTARRKILLTVALAVAIVLIAMMVWKNEIRTAIRDVRYSPTSPVPQTGLDAGRFNQLHQRVLQRKSQGAIDVLFLGDSITEFWESDHARSIWNERFAPMNSANFGISKDATQHVLWRITQGKEIDGLSPKVVVLLIGTNNTPTNSAGAIARGIEQIVATLLTKLPDSKILLLSILPREQGGDGINARIRAVNVRISKLHYRSRVIVVDVHQKFVDSNGGPNNEMFLDGLHLNTNGYQTLAEAIGPKLDTMLGK